MADLFDLYNNGKYEELKEYINSISSASELNAKNKSGRTLLHEVSRLGNTGIAKMLLENGADVNVKDEDGNTPLHLVETEEYSEIFHLLVENGADIKSKNNNEKL